MRLYRLSRIGSVGYDEAAGFVVAAPDESAARATPRAASLGYSDGPGCGDECSHDGRSESPCAWQDAAATTCELRGVAAPDVPPGVVLRSFRAG